MRKPDFIVLGGHKCGTTSLHNYLRQHPQIVLPRIKGTDLLNKPDRLFSFDSYLQQFMDAPKEAIWGEVSSIYLYLERVFERIKLLLPGVKIIILLRNPADRAYSDFMASKKKPADKTFEELIDQGKYLRNGFFSIHIKKYLDSFEKEKIKIILFDNFTSNTRYVIRDLFDFLGVDPNFQTDAAFISRKGGELRNNMFSKIIMAPSVKKLISPFLKMFTTRQWRWRQGAKITNLLTKKYEPLSKKTRKKLIGIYREDILNLDKLIGKDLSNWLR